MGALNMVLIQLVTLAVVSLTRVAGDAVPIAGLSIYSEDPPYDKRFPAEKALTLFLEGSMTKRIYWLLPTGVVDQGFVVDLGAVKQVESITLYNTKNTKYNNMGTADFEINLSTDAKAFFNIGKGTLKDVRNKKQEPEDFAFTGRGRYLQFIVRSFYGGAGGLQFISVFGRDSADDEFSIVSPLADGKASRCRHIGTLRKTDLEGCKNLCRKNPICDTFNFCPTGAKCASLACHIKSCNGGEGGGDFQLDPSYGVKGWDVYNKNACLEGTFRLVGEGSTASKGRIEFCLKRKWGTVCDDGFDQAAGHYICRSLGFSGASKLYGDHPKKSNSADIHPYGRGTKQPVWMTNFDCPHGAKTLAQCTYERNPQPASDPKNCQHYEDTALDCQE